MASGWMRRLPVLLSLAAVSGWASTAHSQVRQAWVATYDGPGRLSDVPTALAVGRDGNTIVTGFSKSGESTTSSRFVTVKFSAEGDLLWVASCGASLHKNEAKALAVDAAGNVHVTGESQVGGGTDWDCATVKYAPDGTELWVARDVDGLSTSEASKAIALDGAGNVLVDGELTSTGIHAILKYDPRGKKLWDKRQDASIAAISADAVGGVYVAGQLVQHGWDGGPPHRRRETLRTMGDLPEMAEFGIVFFNVGVDTFPESGAPAQASPEMKDGAASFVQSAVAGYGSCCREGLVAGLQLANQSTAKRKVILYVGDGGGTCYGSDEATYLRQALVEISNRNEQRVPIHCFGLVDSWPTLGEEFLKELAKANGGTYTRIGR